MRYQEAVKKILALASECGKKIQSSQMRWKIYRNIFFTLPEPAPKLVFINDNSVTMITITGISDSKFGFIPTTLWPDDQMFF